jgi:hypothetical protein
MAARLVRYERREPAVVFLELCVTIKWLYMLVHSPVFRGWWWRGRLRKEGGVTVADLAGLRAGMVILLSTFSSFVFVTKVAFELCAKVVIGSLAVV